MKIGILTQALLNNYGGILQNYALQQVLKRMGHEVETLDHGKVSSIHNLIGLLQDWVAFIIMPTKHKCPLERQYQLSAIERKIVNKNTSLFVQKYISCSKPIFKRRDFESLHKKEKYDALVVGSDQCWRPQYNVFLNEMFLEFAQKSDIIRVAYAASFGTDSWEMTENQTLHCAQLASLFNLITVREDSGIKLCRDYLGVESFQVLDPTMLLDKNDYERIVSLEKEPVSNGQLFYYILDSTKEKNSIITFVANKLQLESFSVMPPVHWENITRDVAKNNISSCVYPRVTKWLQAFIDAEMIIVDSFHGAVFSIIFNKPFWVLENNDRGKARFDSLLKLFDLEDRYVNINIVNNSEFDWERRIDWAKVNQIREEKKQYSLNLLLAGLRNNK